MDGLTAAAVLGVSPCATRREIVRAYRARAKQVHPDLVAAGPDRPHPDEDFITLRAALDCLLVAASPAVPEPVRPAGRAFTAGSWFVPATVPAVPVIDLTDAAPLPRIGSVTTPVAAPRPEGRRFTDCLAAELARLSR